MAQNNVTTRALSFLIKSGEFQTDLHYEIPEALIRSTLVQFKPEIIDRAVEVIFTKPPALLPALKQLKGVGQATARQICEEMDQLMSEGYEAARLAYLNRMNHLASESEADAMAQSYVAPVNIPAERVKDVMSAARPSETAVIKPTGLDRESVAALRLLGLAFKLVLPGSSRAHSTMSAFVKTFVCGGQYGNTQAIQLSKSAFLLAEITEEDAWNIASHLSGSVEWRGEKDNTKISVIEIEPDFLASHADLMRKFVRLVKVIAGFQKKQVDITMHEGRCRITWLATAFEDAAARFNMKMDAAPAASRPNSN